jgi:dethiobiotin synthetase
MDAFYITGTDTDAGKTLVTCALLQAFRARGRTAIGMKPVASGCERTADGWRNEDALKLLANSEPRPDYALVNPFALPDATAPEIAAAHAGVSVTLPNIDAAFRVLRDQADIVLIEGVGGWLAPLAHGFDQSELVRRFDASVILVVGVRLGCINHVRLTARAIAADGSNLIGWIASEIDPSLAHSDEYFDLLCTALPVPCLGRLPHTPAPDPSKLAGHLRLP